MKLIYLTAITTAPNESGEEKIEKASKVNKEEPQIDYRSLGIRPPKGDVEKDEYGNIILDEEDIEEVLVPLTIPIKNIASYVSTIEGGTLIYTKDGIAFNVEEEVWEINAYIQLLYMSWLSKQWFNLKIWFQDFLAKIKGKKKEE